MSFVNKVVIVTGASSGIGASTAIDFAKEGADVAIVGRNETKLKKVTEKIEAFGKKPLVLKLDVAKDGNAEKIVKKTVETFGKLDILINNAGIVRTGNIINGRILKAYDECDATNVRAVIHLTTYAAPHLIKTKGNIVNISSIAALEVHSTETSAYSVSKAALDQFTKATAKELAKYDVRANSINPGPVKTDILENSGFDAEDIANMKKNSGSFVKIAEPEEIADLVLYLAGDKAKGMTGAVIVHDNGLLLRPQ